MKNRNLNMLLKSSVASNKLSTALYCIFIIFSTVLILISVSIAFPLKANIEEKINNHISNRELVTEFKADASDELIKQNIDEIKKVEHVEEVYKMPSLLGVSETSGTLHDGYSLGFIHTGSEVVITSGRAFDESETGVALVPQNIRDFKPEDNRIYDISGESLIGKTLVFIDECDNSHKVEVVGAYSTSDPLYSDTQILIPQSDLNKYTDEVLKNASSGGLSISSDKSYIILIDNAENTEKALDDVLFIRTAYRQPSMIDADTYNTALYILLAMLAFFIVMVVFGFFMFAKNNVNSRTNELALYRSLGYKSKQIFYIIFSEYLFLGLISIAVGIITTMLLNSIFVNPYLFTLVGNTIMEMTVSITLTQIVFIIMLFILILLLVCRSAVKRSEKIDLTILLREQ
ncbi:ABC transporter permease [uncultured Ruminococcus sp.]|uniref:ABC transporter permease n=1 Tax=uncultured Ruminococcus sp. TaxID=165186 RepID=UPI0025F22794|nr:FtsX-like permease family protein [uncultured Ruminococcus sp.]